MIQRFRNYSLTILFFLPLVFCSPVWAADLTNAEQIALGRRIFESRGANTCLMCHGQEGRGGTIAEASNLRQPRTWNITKQMFGPDGTRPKDPESLRRFEEANRRLIAVGAIAFNRQHAAEFGLKERLNPLMYGAQQAPSQAEIARIGKEIESREGKPISREDLRDRTAAYLWEYVKTLDDSGFFRGK